MSDKLGNRAKLDRTRIDVEQDWEVLYWATKFNVSGCDVREAVESVGPQVGDVRAYLVGEKSAPGN